MEVHVKGSPNIEVTFESKVIEVEGSGIVDTALSLESENPVTNKAITEELNKKVDAANLATINGHRIDEGGEIVIEGGGESYDDTALKEAISKKADKDGIYPEMSVGQSANLLGVSDGESGEFLFRPTDGDGSIKDGIASIERIEGNSVVWNQCFGQGKTTNNETWNGNQVTINGVWDVQFDTFDTKASNALFVTPVIGHKSLTIIKHISGLVTTGAVTIVNYAIGKSVRLTPSSSPQETAFFAENINGGYWTYRQYAAGTSVENLVVEINIHDLTQMFGAGNEPTTIEEFNARKPKVEDEYAYNEGEVINMCADSIKTVGFNAWDEEWELGTFNTTTGADIARTDQIRSKNLIRVLPNTQYYFKTPVAAWIISYDKDGKVIEGYNGGTSASISGNSFSVDPLNCVMLTHPRTKYIKFYLLSPYGATYNHDICIHLVHTGYRNGEYEPYVSNEKALPIADYFPNGMNAIGDVKDELTPTEAIQRIGVVDLGSLNYYYNTNNGGDFYVNLEGAKTPSSWALVGNLLSALYSKTNANAIAQSGTTPVNMSIAIAPNGNLYVVNTAYTDAATFKAAMQGVMLYYELAEPIVTKIDTPLDLTYPAWDFGTEEIIADTPTTPFRGSIIYEFNARDTIRANKKAIEGMAIEDYADGKLKVSINGVSKDFMAATPSGDPMHYMYVTAGAEYNDTGADITRTGVYGDTIVWKAGYWWLNELGDITNEEMREIYAYRYPTIALDNIGSWWQGNRCRTILSSARTNMTAHSEKFTYFSSTIETIYHPNTVKNYGILLTMASSMCRECSKLTKVLQYIDCQYITSANNMDRPFIGCTALKEVRIKTLKFAISFQDSPLLSNASILYMIENEAATAAIVITLHADAYARAMADEAITTALAAHPNVSLASA